MRNISADTIQEALINQTVHEMLREKYASRPQKRMKMVNSDAGKEFFNFIIVRHPFVRLVSSFTAWMRAGCNENQKSYFPQRRKGQIRKFKEDESYMFPEFVDYLIRTPPNLMDKNWSPYSKVFINILS